ncbi:MAG: hypothetical protein NTU58_01275 [Candidatus Nealsonbacteria bacterium]|nr:hypothetical protein [Candidatus Nealsonbacteria bacterium]
MKPYEIPLVIISFILGIFLLSVALSSTAPNWLAFVGGFIKTIVK